MFEKIIGYDTEKTELARFCDIIRNPDYYKSFGVSIPKGIILYGPPGVGKTTFANSIIESSGRPSFVIRKNADTAEFIKHVIDVFEQAKANAPSVILLDDMDKFGDGNAFSQEYTSLQGILDDYRDYDIFVIGTANELFKLPPSLTRSGRFDRLIEINNPNKNESKDITIHYMSDKNIDPSVNMNTVAAMVPGCSCATLESVINMAALAAVYERTPTIQMSHIIDAILTTVYGMPKQNSTRTPKETYMAAIHEAGHGVINYIVSPDTFSFVTIRQTKLGKPFDRSTAMISEAYGASTIDTSVINSMILLGGKAAIEIKFGITDPTASLEIKDAMDLIQGIYVNAGAGGFDKVASYNDMNMDFGYSTDKGGAEVIQAMNDIYNRDKDILRGNWSFLEAVASELIKKETLVKDDFDAIRYGYNSNRFSNLIRRD